MNVQLALIRRELWEHRAIYVVPVVVGLLVCLMSVTGQVVVSAFDQPVDAAIFGASALGERERAAAISVMLTAISSPLVLTMAILSVFYLLDCLYSERKDRSILFWRSLPVTDAETVLSKLLTALLLIPLVTFAVVVLTQLLFLTISGTWVSLRGGSGWQLLWSAAPLFDNWLATLLFVLSLALWLSPFAGWFLLVSAWTKRSPFLVGFLPLIVAPMLERILLGTKFLSQAIFVRTGNLPLFRHIDFSEYVLKDGDSVTLTGDATLTALQLMSPGRFLASPSLWLGVLVCALLTAGAIYVRRYRDDS